MSIVGHIGIANDKVANDEKIFNAGRLPYNAFKVRMLTCTSILESPTK